MKIGINIPGEFEEHFKQDKFKNSLARIMAGIKHSLEDGNYVYGTKYEYETIEMLKKAFEDSKSAYDVDKVVDVQTKEIKWISVEDRLPDDGDSRFYMCLVENHLEEPPMYCQYEEEYGFGFWNDIYDSVTLGFVDSEFRTMEELHYEKVRYWMPLIEPPKDEEGARNEIDSAIEIVKAGVKDE